MFEKNDMNIDPMNSGRATLGNEPSVNDMFSRQETQQSASGSYYSPRNGGSSGYVPPTGNGPRGPYDNFDDDGQPKKKAHKGLKAVAVFASVAFVAYASIQCYQFATENESVRSFLGKQSNSVAEQSSEESAESSAAEVTTKAAVESSAAESSAAESLGFIELASRENAMSIPDIVDKVTPATVGVASTFLYEGQTYSMWGFGQAQRIQQEMPASGTGIIMSDNGNGSYYIITNAHVIYTTEYNMGLAQKVQIQLNKDYYSGDTVFDADIIGYDTAEDLAVLKITTSEQLTVAEFGDSDELRVGELVVAIGNPLGFEYFGSVSTGIVSALDREVSINDTTMRLIQTDTAINNGNSGGPLINSYGQVIGINSAKLSSSYASSDSASIEGMCFAIPITHAKSVINDLINYGYVTGKPMMGINLTVDIDENLSQRLGIPVGVYVKEIAAGGAAELAGMQRGDVIVAINNTPISTYEELKAEKDKYKAGESITVTATRNGQDMKFEVTLQEKVPNVN